MDTIFSVRKLLSTECFLAFIDLRFVYLHIPIARASQKYLRLAISLSSSPRIFAEIMAEALALLRKGGVSIVPYLDDLLFTNSKDMLFRDLKKDAESLRKFRLASEQRDVKADPFPDQISVLLHQLCTRKKSFNQRKK